MLLADTQRKPLIRIIYELARTSLRIRGIPRYYFNNRLYRLDVENPLDYLNPQEVARINAFVRNPEIALFFQNKVLFQHHFRNSQIRLPRFFGYNVGPAFFSEEGQWRLDSPHDLAELATRLLAGSGFGCVFLKPVGGRQGQHCYKLRPAAEESEQLRRLYQQVRSGSFVFEESVVQNPLLSAIYPHSVNTLRIITCTRADCRPEVVSALIRFGANGSFVDNASSGGVFAKVDLATGAVAPYARKFAEYGGTIHSHHPDTGFGFSGFVVPHFAAAIEIAKVAAAHLPYRLVGWDIAIDRDGPVLIEGNGELHIIGAEIADGGYKNNPVFSAFLREIPS